MKDTIAVSFMINSIHVHGKLRFQRQHPAITGANVHLDRKTRQ